MADVTGSFGQEDVVLNNAATEATLKQLLSAMQVVAAKAKSEFKNHADFEKAMGNLAGTTQNQVKAGKKFNDATLRSYKAKEQETASVEDNIKAYNESVKKITHFQANVTKAAGAIVGLINKVSSAAEAVRGMDGSVSSAVGALGQIPMGVGDVIKGIFGPVAGAVDQTHQAFLEASTVGANFGGNMKDMLEASGGAGLSLSEFTGIVKGNSEALMFLGGSTDEGAKRLAKLGKDIRNTPLAADLARLGFSTADINEGFADYSKMLAKNGRLQGKSDADLIAGTHAYLKNLDAVSKLTGKSKESLQAEEDARQADAQYRIMMAQLDDTGQKNMKALMDSIPKQHQAGLKEILATGTATTDAGIEVMAYLKKSGTSAQELFNTMNSTGTLTTKQATDFNKLYQKESEEFAKSPLAETLGKFDPAANAFVTGVLDVAARTTTLEEQLAANEKKLKDIADGITKEDIIDPATIQKFKQDINQKSIEMTTALASIDLAPLKKVFDTAADIAVEYLPKAVNLAAENFEVVAGTVLAFNSAALLATVALKGMSLAAGASMMGGPGKAGKAKVGGGMPGAAGPGGVSKGAVAKGVARRFLPLAVLMSAYEGYTGAAAADKKAEAGEITGNEATVEKSEAIGGAVGGGGGALAGAAAGAALGSVVPIVGTAIGGLIGGAIGYWAGSKGGEMAGEAIGDAIAGEDNIRDLEAQIAEEQARIDRSKSGENEYYGREHKGIEKSQAKILQLQKDLELVQKRADEAKAKAEAAKVKEAEGNVAEEENNIATEAEAGNSSSTSTTATDAQKKLEAEKEKEKNDAIKKQEELKKKTDEEKKAKQDELSSINETKKTPEEIMLALNTNIEELVSLTRLSNSLSQKHIGVAQGMSNDAYTVG